MMKYGAHCYIFTEHWSDDELHLFDTARELGLDCFEIAIGDDVSLNPAATRRAASNAGIELILSPGALWPRECDLASTNPAYRARGLAWHCRQIDLTAEVGGTAYTGALYGHPGVLHYRLLSADESLHIADGLCQLAEHGARNGIKVVIEPMSHFRTHVVNTPEQAIRLIAQADHPNLYVLLDTYHMVTEVRDYATAIRSTSERLWGLHACENDRGVPGGVPGLVPWTQVFDALKDTHFDGYMILESYNSSLGNPAGSFAHRRGMLHNVCPDGRTFVQTGLNFLKQSLKK